MLVATKGVKKRLFLLLIEKDFTFCLGSTLYVICNVCFCKNCHVFDFLIGVQTVRGGEGAGGDSEEAEWRERRWVLTAWVITLLCTDPTMPYCMLLPPPPLRLLRPLLWRPSGRLHDGGEERGCHGRRGAQEASCALGRLTQRGSEAPQTGGADAARSDAFTAPRVRHSAAFNVILLRTVEYTQSLIVSAHPP